MSTSKTRVDSFRMAGFVALGLEFARSHGIEYAQALMEQIGASEEAIALMLKQCAGQNPESAPADTREAAAGWFSAQPARR